MNTVSAIIVVLMACMLSCKGQTSGKLKNDESKDIFVPKGTNYTLVIYNNLELRRTHCPFYDVQVFLLEEGNANSLNRSRLASCPLQKLKPDSIIGVIINNTKDKFGLGKVSLLCLVNKTSTYHHQFKVHLMLEIILPEEATNHPSVDELVLIKRCLKRNDSNLGTRQKIAHYHLVYKEPEKISPTDIKNPGKPATCTSPLSTAGTLTVTDGPPSMEPGLHDDNDKRNLRMILGIPGGVIALIVIVVLVVCCRDKITGIIKTKKNRHGVVCYNNNSVNTA